MTNQQIRSALTAYEEIFNHRGVSPRELPSDRCPRHSLEIWDHALSMIPKMRDWIEDKTKREELMRWLGFLQAILWLKGICTLEQLKNDNR